MKTPHHPRLPAPFDPDPWTAALVAFLIWLTLAVLALGLLQRLFPSEL